MGGGGEWGGGGGGRGWRRSAKEKWDVTNVNKRGVKLVRLAVKLACDELELETQPSLRPRLPKLCEPRRRIARRLEGLRC